MRYELPPDHLWNVYFNATGSHDAAAILAAGDYLLEGLMIVAEEIRLLREEKKDEPAKSE